MSEGPPPTFVSRLPRTIGLLALFGLLVIVAINTLRTPGRPSSGPAVGRALPAFAAPLVDSDLQGDVNVATRAGQGAAGERPACELRGAGIVNTCDLIRRAPLVLAFFSAGEGRCLRAIDALDREARAAAGVKVLAVALGGERSEVRRIVDKRGWRIPVAHDRDAILANLYGVAVCPQVTYVLRGGRVQRTVVGEQQPSDWSSQLARLQATEGAR